MARLEDACRDVAAFVDEKNLRRAGSFLLIGDRARSGIRWKKGKGVVGLAWAEERVVVKDLEDVRRRARTVEEYAALPEADRLGLSWDEFRKTPRYRAFYAVQATESPGFDGVIGVCESALKS